MTERSVFWKMTRKKVSVVAKVRREASHWTRYFETKPTKHDVRRSVENAVLGKEVRN